MTVLVEPGHQNEYPFNHARFLWDNKITSISATGAATSNPASAALTNTTYERWSPTATGQILTGTFTEQVINAIGIAAHSNLTPTIEVRVNGTWEEVQAFPVEGATLESDFANQQYGLLEYAPDNEAILLLIKDRLCDGVRVTATYTGTAPTIGVLMAGKVLEMARPFYSGHSPALQSSESTVRPNISDSGEWLGASLIRQGRNVSMQWDNLPAPWVRQKFMPFSEALLTNPFIVAWNAKRFSDAVYCSSSERPSPSNSGTLNYQSISLNARAYSDGTEPNVTGLAEVDFADQYTFTRASEATYFDFNGVLRTAAIDEPRFTYDPVTGEALGLLIEEARKNLLLNSDSPATQSVTVSNATEYTLSVYGSGSAEVTIGGSGTATDGNDLTFTTTGTTVEVTVTGTLDYFQLEAGSFATSIIITAGTQVTRAADNCSRTLGAEFNAGEFTYVLDFETAGTSDSILSSLTPEDAAFGKGLFAFDVKNNDFRLLARNITSTTVTSIPASTGRHVFAVSFDRGDVLVSFDGLPAEQVPNIISNDVTNLYFGKIDGGGSVDGVTNYRDSALIPRALSATELQELTAP